LTAPLASNQLELQMFFDHIPADAALVDLNKKQREEWEALVFLEELGILVLSHPIAPSAVPQSAVPQIDKDRNQEKPKAA
jgi:hypothetical protein